MVENLNVNLKMLPGVHQQSVLQMKAWSGISVERWLQICEWKFQPIGHWYHGLLSLATRNATNN